MSAVIQNSQKRLADRDLITPEGVNLGVRLADVSTRFGALVMDLLVMVVILIVATIVISVGGNGIGGEAAFIIWILMFFVLRNFYFMLFEMGPRAATPGKRLMKIRVASRSGARLSTSAIFARNAMREIELFLPVILLLSGGTLTGQQDTVDGWMWLAALIWFMIFAFFPLFNKDRLRVGDLIAGTWVVRAPKPELLPDLAADASPSRDQYAFSPKHLAAYGIAELHVLEDVLRVR
ncbi:MAG: RDD family protein, partial [Pseudomonadota bacterium]